jgi:solute carrier family 25 (mitochondrial carnitine/acylcarnitine transporter), member 20/29
MTRNEANPSAFFTLMAGGFAGTFSWLVSFPIDVVKSRLQADGLNGKFQYSGLVNCIQKSYQLEGLSFLSRGLAATLMRAFPMNAVCFLIVSYTMKLFSGNTPISIEIREPAPLVNVGPLIMPIIPPFTKRENRFMRSLITLGAFSEAVCSSEIEEIANDFCNSCRLEPFVYYQQADDGQSHYDIVLRTVEWDGRTGRKDSVNDNFTLLSD